MCMLGALRACPSAQHTHLHLQFLDLDAKNQRYIADIPTGVELYMYLTLLLTMIQQ